METAPAAAVRATLVATVTTPPGEDLAAWASTLAGVDWLEVRGDLVGDLDPAPLRKGSRGSSSTRCAAAPRGGPSKGRPSGGTGG